MYRLWYCLKSFLSTLTGCPRTVAQAILVAVHICPVNSSSLLLDYTVSAATSSCRLAVPEMTPEPSVTVHILGFRYSTFPAARDMLRHVLVSRALTHGGCYQLVGFCVMFCTVCCAWLRLLSLFTGRCGFYESAHVRIFRLPPRCK